MNDIQNDLERLLSYLDRLIQISIEENNPELEKQANRVTEKIEEQVQFFNSNHDVDQPKELGVPLGEVLINIIKLLRGINRKYQALDNKDKEIEGFINQNKRLFWALQGYLNYSPDVDSSGETLFIP